MWCFNENICSTAHTGHIYYLYCNVEIYYNFEMHMHNSSPSTSLFLRIFASINVHVSHFFFLPPFLPPFLPFFFFLSPPASFAGHGVGFRGSNLMEKSAQRGRKETVWPMQATSVVLCASVGSRDTQTHRRRNHKCIQCQSGMIFSTCSLKRTQRHGQGHGPRQAYTQSARAREGKTYRHKSRGYKGQHVANASIDDKIYRADVAGCGKCFGAQ